MNGEVGRQKAPESFSLGLLKGSLVGSLCRVDKVQIGSTRCPRPQVVNKNVKHANE